MVFVSFPNWFCRFVTLSETLKKSTASQVQASHPGERVQHDCGHRCTSYARTRPKVTPLHPRQRAQGREERLASLAHLAAWNETGEESGRHGSERAGRGGPTG